MAITSNYLQFSRVGLVSPNESKMYISQFAHEELVLRGTTFFLEKKNHRLDPVREIEPDDLDFEDDGGYEEDEETSGSQENFQEGEQDYLIDRWGHSRGRNLSMVVFTALWTLRRPRWLWSSPLLDTHHLPSLLDRQVCQCMLPSTGYPSTVFSMDKSWRWTGSRIGPFDKRFRKNWCLMVFHGV